MMIRQYNNKIILIFVLRITFILKCVYSLREYRAWSNRTFCEKYQTPYYPYAYQKYPSQTIETKSRTNTNKQDFRHVCQTKGGQSKCHICEDSIINGQTIHLQLQGIDTSQMSKNIPIVTDTAWVVNGQHRYDYGASNAHYCVFLSGGDCIHPNTTDFSGCKVRCFGAGSNAPAIYDNATTRSLVNEIYTPLVFHEDKYLQEVDLWTRPNNCSTLLSSQGISCTYTTPTNTNTQIKIPSYNPQGFTSTIAGKVGQPGFVDGNIAVAQFNSPEGVAVDSYGVVYIADTNNHAIRMISLNGTVTTLAGQGNSKAGFQDGNCIQATFNKPKDIDVRTDILSNINDMKVTLAIADTGNHRIRKLIYYTNNQSCIVQCISGLCGNSTLSETLTHTISSPQPGYSDGDGIIAKFATPTGVIFMNDYNDDLLITDTDNYLIRYIQDNNNNNYTTYTLAGTVVSGETDSNGDPVPGCAPPCLKGLQGFNDGDLTHTQFFNPISITRGINGSFYITDQNRIRILDMPYINTTINGVISQGRVSTLSGNTLQGREDGYENEATFFEPTGIVTTSDNIVYVVDSASCHLRRISPITSVAPSISCTTSAVELVPPSGCTSYDLPLDKIGRKISRVESNVIYNYGDPYLTDIDRGKYIKSCLGTPPRDVLDKHISTNPIYNGDNLVIDDGLISVNEDNEAGMTVLVKCDPTCSNSINSMNIYGTEWYTESSSICGAALHSGILNSTMSSDEGYIQVTYQRKDYITNTSQNTDMHHIFYGSSGYNGVTSLDALEIDARIFKVHYIKPSRSIVHTVGGAPSAPLESACGYHDGQPSLLSRFSNPHGIAAAYHTSASNSNYLYIADTNNHIIRAVSAACTQICENGGTCMGPDICVCPSGWSGIDCTIPICSTPCNTNHVCTGPDSCTPKPGYSGPSGDVPLCKQTCLNGGNCIYPDTCSCLSGWFDPTCSTPVSSFTCGNGGNVTGPNICTCPNQWTGIDCRIPVCTQTCHHGGLCIAPDTCMCTPQWTNYDCSEPICTQGYFIPYTYDSSTIKTMNTNISSSTLIKKPIYRPCDINAWCDVTNDFECLQEYYIHDIITVPYGPFFRNMTGKTSSTNNACFNIELPLDYRTPFSPINTQNIVLNYQRYSNFTPYESSGSDLWSGYAYIFPPPEGVTGPWMYSADRQIFHLNWYNITQGRYVCANNGTCSSPDVCVCAPGWVGFDCRTPVCTQGSYYPQQKTYVSGLETSDELEHFSSFMGYNSYRLNWPYSNPNYTTEIELFLNSSTIIRQNDTITGTSYLGPEILSANSTHMVLTQGGYRCSIRSITIWENATYLFTHPNYYSRYMDEIIQADGNIYTNWMNMSWLPIYNKTKILDQIFNNRTYVYTDEGFRRNGIWILSGNNWTAGTCILEFKRVCPNDSSKQIDLESQLNDVYVQDTDLAYRARIQYTDSTVLAQGRWRQQTGECVDQVIRGCHNNGTCTGPNTCACAPGWSGYDCTVPLCTLSCQNNGNCTLPDTCTCERGWSGPQCTIPLCAQECLNGGYCVAPDTCKCVQWPNKFRDGRLNGGTPLFQDLNGKPQMTGWTGYDCSTPICVQAETFHVNIRMPISKLSAPELNIPIDIIGETDTNLFMYTSLNLPLKIDGLYRLGGRGADGLLECLVNGQIPPRCAQYDFLVTSNSGVTFQSGCGYDPIDTGCCIKDDVDTDAVICYYCLSTDKIITNHTFECNGPIQSIHGNIHEIQSVTNRTTSFWSQFLDVFYNIRLCGAYHSPRHHNFSIPFTQQDYGTAAYFKNPEILYRNQLKYSSQTYLSTQTSNRFLCHVTHWYEGNFNRTYNYDNYDMNDTMERTLRLNYLNFVMNSSTQQWYHPIDIYGEGVYACANGGSCLGPDYCSCTDGYEGYDCKTPLCRHLQPSGQVTSCLNGGICYARDTCKCIQVPSILWKVYPDTSRGLTGWSGSDCSMPMCVQGYFDPFCTDMENAPGGEGCYRCANGGNCTAPDLCTCAPGWSGYDCRTPVCEYVVDSLTRYQLGTAHEDKIIAFESDPCGVEAIYGRHGFKGKKYTRGNCTQPNQCTCLCKEKYDRKKCRRTGNNCNGPWQDELVRYRDVLTKHGPEYEFGTTSCAHGYEGDIDNLNRFTTCHLTIYVPSTVERISLILIICVSVGTVVLIVLYYFIRQRLKRRYLLAKIERRRNRRAEEPLLAGQDGAGGAFYNN